MTRARESFLAPQFPAGNYPAVKQVRSTLLSASFQGIRQMGWEERYFRALPASRHEEIRGLTAGVWLPIQTGIAHYTACDEMALTSDEMQEMGKAVALRTQKTFVGTLGTIAAGAGATPWSIFQHSHRIWGRIFDGGDHVIYRIGPKDLEVHTLGCSLLHIRYFRTAVGAYYSALASLVASSVHWRELPEYRREETNALRISWV